MARTKTPPSDAGENFLEGKLLIAMPGMSDPHFEKSVVFMCAHSADGAMGIIINKPVTGLSFHDLMQKLELAVTPSTPNFPILYGGPVEPGRGLVVQCGDDGCSVACLPVAAGLWLLCPLDLKVFVAD